MGNLKDLVTLHNQTAQASLFPAKQPPNRKRESDTEWGEVAIGDICHLVNGRAFKPAEWTDIGLPIIRIQNLNDENKPFNYYNGTFDPKHEVNDGDVLISWSGTPGTSFGAFIWTRGRAVLNQHIFRAELDEDHVDKKFFVHSVNWRLEELIRRAHGGVGLRHITKSELEAVTLRLPYPCDPARSLDIQRRIAARIEALLAELREARALAAAIRYDTDRIMDAALEQVFPDLDGTETTTLGAACELEMGQSPLGTSYADRPVGPPLLNGPTEFGDHHPTPVQWTSSPTKLCRPGDLLLCVRGATTGRTNWADQVYCLGRGVAAIRSKDPRITDLGYVAYFIRSRAQAILKAGRGSTFPNISKRDLEAWKLPNRNLSEQMQIVSYLDVIQTEVNEMRRLQAQDAELLDQLEQSILERAFKGEL